MDIRSEIRAAPRALKETLEKGKPEFDEVVRRTRWSEGPLYLVGSGASFPPALAGVYAFAELLGWPVIAVHAPNFLAYSASTLRPRSVVLVITPSAEDGPSVEVARQARARGATLLAMTASATGSLAESADGIFLIRPEEGHAVGPQAELCQHAAMGFLAMTAAHALKRHHQKLDALEHEYDKLPEHAEWVLTRLTDAARSLAVEIGKESNLVLVGGGSYYSAALQAGRCLAELASIRTRVADAAEFSERDARPSAGKESILCLSGCRSRFRKSLGETASLARQAGARVFSVTDANDRELAEASTLAVFLPALDELPGSALALLFVQCLIAHLPHGIVRPSEKSGMKPASSKGNSKSL